MQLNSVVKDDLDKDLSRQCCFVGVGIVVIVLRPVGLGLDCTDQDLLRGEINWFVVENLARF